MKAEINKSGRIGGAWEGAAPSAASPDNPAIHLYPSPLKLQTHHFASGGFNKAKATTIPRTARAATIRKKGWKAPRRSFA